jgi:hypothetical protein
MALTQPFFLDKCYLKNNPKPHTCYTCKYYKLSMLSPLSVKNANNTQVLQVSLLWSDTWYRQKTSLECVNAIQIE